MSENISISATTTKFPFLFLDFISGFIGPRLESIHTQLGLTAGTASSLLEWNEHLLWVADIGNISHASSVGVILNLTCLWNQLSYMFILLLGLLLSQDHLFQVFSQYLSAINISYTRTVLHTSTLPVIQMLNE